MAYYLTELNSAISLDVDTGILDANEINLINTFGGNDAQEITGFDTGSGDKTLNNGEFLGVEVGDADPTTISGEYLGNVELSTASIKLLGIKVAVNPVQGELFQADDGTLYMISEKPLGDDQLGVTVTFPLGGGEFNVPLSELEDVPAIGPVLGGVMDTLNATVMTVDHDQDGSFTVCFAAGTMIATPKGEVAVETLSIGDMVLTASGKQVPVKWIGRQTFGPLASAQNPPVCVGQDALAPGAPNQDLVLTAGHALIIDGLAINAGALVNNSTIDYVPQSELSQGMTYYHIETDNHDVILANGTEAETYVDYITRQAFDNYDEYVELYGIETRIVEMPQPRISTRRHVPQVVRERLGIEDTTPVSRVA